MRGVQRYMWFLYAALITLVLVYMAANNKWLPNSTMLRVPSIRVQWSGVESELDKISLNARTLYETPDSMRTDTGLKDTVHVNSVNISIHELAQHKGVELGESLNDTNSNTATKIIYKYITREHIIKPTDKSNGIKIFCMVKTQPLNYVKKAQAVKDTWGKRCDQLLFVSSTANTSLPAIGVLTNEKESRNLLSQKVFRGLKYVYEHFIDKFDWFFVCDDDTFMIIENLRHFLADKDNRLPVYYGHRFMKYTPQGYSSGGSGYVMSREALNRVGKNGHKHKMCNQKGTGSDFRVGQCLYELGVKLEISTDSKGRSRFHCFNVEGHLFGAYPNWYKLYTKDADGSRWNDISDYPISFHYCAGKKMYIMNFLFYRSGVWGLKSTEQ